MSALAINTKYVNIGTGRQGVLTIESEELKLSIVKDDKILILKSKENGLAFTDVGSITEVINTTPKPIVVKLDNKKSDTAKPKYLHHFAYTISTHLTQNNLLRDLEYSLPFIENHHKPEVHFQSQYRFVPQDDFETIINGWLYATRTVFGKLVNALPRQNRLEFALQAMDHFETIDLGKVNIVNGLDFLYKYIDKRIISRGKLLVATDKLLKSKLGNSIVSDEIGFIDPENHKIQNIHLQADIFSDLFKLDENDRLKQELELTIRTNSELEDRFQKKFNRKAWPIDLER